jgi:signal transduction histidine kinase
VTAAPGGSPAPQAGTAGPAPSPRTGRAGRLVADVVHFLSVPDEDPGGPSLGPVGSLRVLRRHPLTSDALLSLALFALSLHQLLHPVHRGTEAWVLTAALIAPLVLRRRAPVAVFGLLAAVAFVQWTRGYPLVADLSLLVALYTVAIHRPRRVTLAAAMVLELGVVMASLRFSPAGSWIRSLVFLSAMVAAVVLRGRSLRARRANLAALAERAERAERERDQQARLATAAERARIAREMHDIIAHSLAVMVALADGAAAKVAREPDRAATAIGQVADLGRQSLRETRRLLGVLRETENGTPGPTAPLPPTPGFGDLRNLVAQVQATGLATSFHVAGDPLPSVPGAGLAVYRIVQEALTNTLKHAPDAGRVDVSLAYHAPVLDVTVRDDGHLPAAGAGAAGNGHGVGHGLGGMRERAAVYQGHVTAGPDPEGGWRVHARLHVPGGSS